MILFLRITQIIERTLVQIFYSHIKYEFLNPIDKTYIQSAGIKITCDNSVNIFSIHSPPRHNIKCEQYEAFFEQLRSKFIVGPWWGSRLTNPKGKELFKCISRNHHSFLSTGRPTYWPTDRAKIADLLDFVVFSGISRTYLDILDSDDLSSEHSALIVTYCTICESVSKQFNIINNKTDTNYFKT